MLLRRGIFHLTLSDIDDLERRRRFVEEAAATLKRFPRPDTFLGRKTQEPFPHERESNRWVALSLVPSAAPYSDIEPRTRSPRNEALDVLVDTHHRPARGVYR